MEELQREKEGERETGRWLDEGKSTCKRQRGGEEDEEDGGGGGGCLKGRQRSLAVVIYRVSRAEQTSKRTYSAGSRRGQGKRKSALGGGQRVCSLKLLDSSEQQRVHPIVT